MENQINDPFFKCIVLTTLVCGVMFVTNRPTQLAGNHHNHDRSRATVAGNVRANPTAPNPLKSISRKPVIPNDN
jgi:hypothetical protein